MASNHVAYVTGGGLTKATLAHSLYGYCTTAAGTAAKVVTMYSTGSTAGAAWAAADLVHGLTITVRFQYSNTASSPTLNVNSTGAKPIYKYGTTAPGTTVATSWPAQGVVQLTYDTLLNTSGCWVMNDHTDDTNTAQNQNAFSNVKVGSTTIAADTTTDTLELAAGSNITLTPDATNDKVTIAATDTTYSDFTGATSSAAGAHGLVPAPAAGDNSKYLKGNKTWDAIDGDDVTISIAGTYVTGTPLLNAALATLDGAVANVSGQLSGKQDKFANQSANKVFAGPASGNAAAPSFRSLVEADIPGLAASKITSGTLATARGGVPTGGTTGQVLTKTSDTDNAVEWQTPQSGTSYGIIKQPQNFTVPALGYSFTFEVITNDPNATYQWQTSEDSGSTWANSGLNNNKKSRLGPIDATAARLTYQYRCAVTFTGASEPVYTDAVTLSLATPTEQSTYYGTCGTAAGTTAKVVTCNGYALKPGNLISILFTTANTAAAPTLNINSTAAKSVYVGAALASATNSCKWPANTIVTFIYDGTYYRYLNQVAANTVENWGYTWYGTSSTAATTAAKVITCANFRLVAGARISILFSTANTAAVPTLNVNSTGAKAIWINNKVASATNPLYWDANELVEFVYDGTIFRHVASAISNDEIDDILDDSNAVYDSSLSSPSEFFKLSEATSSVSSSTNTYLSTPIPDGYTFLCWIEPESSGWIGSPYIIESYVENGNAVAHLWYAQGTGEIIAKALFFYTAW